MMYQKIKTILCIGIFAIGTFGLSAQTDTIVGSVPNVQQGEIVISKSDLIKFLDKVAQARKDKIEFELENNYLDNLTLPQHPISRYGASSAATMSVGPLGGNTPLQTMSRDQLLREVEALTSRLNYIAGYAGSEGATTFITAPSSFQDEAFYPYQTQDPLIAGMPYVAPMASNANLRWQMDSLQRKVNFLSAPSAIIKNKDEIDSLNQQIGLLQDSLIGSLPLTPQAREIVKRYGTSQMQVYFDNDVFDVSPSYYEEVERAAILLKNNFHLAAVLKGFASPVGNAKYNYDLSMRRNEAVKRMLIDFGVFPDQITSVFYGEDKTSSADNARRVDIKFIIK